MWELPFTFADPIQSVVGGASVAAIILAILVAYRKRIWPLRPAVDFVLDMRLSSLEVDSRVRLFERTLTALIGGFLALALFALTIVLGVLKNPPEPSMDERMRQFFDQHNVDPKTREEKMEKIREQMRQLRERRAPLRENNPELE